MMMMMVMMMMMMITAVKWQMYSHILTFSKTKLEQDAVVKEVVHTSQFTCMGHCLLSLKASMMAL